MPQTYLQLKYCATLTVAIALTCGATPANAQKKKAPVATPAAVAESPPIKLGDWLGEGDGRALPDGAGFAHEGKKPLVISNSKLKEKAMILTGDVLLPVANATFRIDFAKPQPPVPAPAKTEPQPTAPAPVPPAPKPPAPFIGNLAQNGKTLRIGAVR